MLSAPAPKYIQTSGGLNADEEYTQRRRGGMMQPLPLFLVSEVPGEIAYSIGGAGGLAIAALWRRLVFVEDRSRADKLESITAIRDATDAMRQVLIELRGRGGSDAVA